MRNELDGNYYTYEEMADLYSIRDRAKLSKRLIRHYDSIGLIDKARRFDKDNKLYYREDTYHLFKSIQRWLSLGLELNDLVDLKKKNKNLSTMYECYNFLLQSLENKYKLQINPLNSIGSLIQSDFIHLNTKNASIGTTSMYQDICHAVNKGLQKRTISGFRPGLVEQAIINDIIKSNMFKDNIYDPFCGAGKTSDALNILCEIKNKKDVLENYAWLYKVDTNIVKCCQELFSWFVDDNPKRVEEILLTDILRDEDAKRLDKQRILIAEKYQLVA
jgi:DNA-binding transcriptional MerR regulator